jgi:hypothetical protein
VDKEAILLSSGPYHSHLLWFKIITPTIQTDIGEGPIARGGKGALTSNCKSEKANPIHEVTKILDARHNGHWLMHCK